MSDSDFYECGVRGGREEDEDRAAEIRSLVEDRGGTDEEFPPPNPGAESYLRAENRELRRRLADLERQHKAWGEIIERQARHIEADKREIAAMHRRWHEAGW